MTTKQWGDMIKQEAVKKLFKNSEIQTEYIKLQK